MQWGVKPLLNLTVTKVGRGPACLSGIYGTPEIVLEI